MRFSQICWFVILFHMCHGLHEDQVGKFDWHQKYIGRIRFIVNDPSQPKRIIVGAEKNIVGALNGNNGNVLYRQVLESDGKLIHLGLYNEKYFVAVSAQELVVKIRTFSVSNGVLNNVWAVPLEPGSKAISAVEANGHFYILTTSSSGDVTITSHKVLQTNSDDNEDIKDWAGTSLKFVSSKKVGFRVKSTGQACGLAGPFFVCSEGKSLSVFNVADGIVSNVNEAFDIEEISFSGGEIPAVAIQGNGITKIYHLLVNSKSGPELMPFKVTVPPKVIVSLSQFKADDRPLLFITQLDAENRLLTIDAYSRTGEKVEMYCFTVPTSTLPIPSLQITQAFCIQSRCGLAAFTKDELLFSTKPEGSSSSKVQVEWTRQEALGSTKAVEMVDYPSEVGPTWNPYSTTLDICSAFISRVRYEIEGIITGESLYSSSLDRFGLRKVIVYATAVGKVLGMDAITGNILYTFILPEFDTFKDGSILLYIQRPAKYTPLKPQAVVIYKRSSSDEAVLFAFNPVEGKPLDQPVIYPKIAQTQMLLTATESTNFLRPILLLDSNNIVHSYPANVPPIQNTHFFLAKESQGVDLHGYAVRHDSTANKLKAKQLWQLNLGKNAQLLGIHTKSSSERVHSQGRVLMDRSVSYKYMNPNLVVVVTHEPEAGNINLFLVDVVSGALVHSFWHKKCRGPVHVVHSEHWLVYTVFSEKNRRVEVNSVELYEGQSQSNSTAFSSFAVPMVQPIVVKQSFIYPTYIQHMAHTRTEKGITNKDILIALPTGGVLELPRLVVQPRLSQQHYTQQIQQDEDGVIHALPYIPELPMPADMIINYNQSVKRIEGIKAWPTRLESTCLVLIYGNDLFYTRITPSKTFDVLKDDFDYWFIMVVLLGLCVAAYISRRFAARKALDQAWR